MGIPDGAVRRRRRPQIALDIHIVGAGNSAGQAAMFFSNHARSVTIVCRGAGLEKGMSRYLVDQIASRTNVRGAAPHGGRGGVRRRLLEAIDVRNAETGQTTRLSQAASSS